MRSTFSSNDAVLAWVLTGACAAAVSAGWAGAPIFQAASTLAVIVLVLAFGWKGRVQGVVRWSLVGIFLLFTGLIAAMAVLADSAGDAQLWLGLPRPTALLVYAVWPLGALPSLLFAFRFRDTVLPPDKLARFLAEHSRHKN